jgi:hypothetical protein
LVASPPPKTPIQHCPFNNGSVLAAGQLKGFLQSGELPLISIAAAKSTALNTSASIGVGGT